ncbi:MAG: hypothetical protein JJT75_07585 [Opitutales bacterium]|nr:hypothetical protein [Opitutales bacterium]MCH8540206.1 hypothetical protein [Opitutales bacterium]
MHLKKSFAWLSLLGLVTGLHAQTYNGQELVKFEAIAESKEIVPGQPFLVGLHMDMADGWHTYWTFSGEAGLATSVSWELPEGMVAGEVLSPLPILKEEDSGLMAYAYYDEVTHFVHLFPSSDLEPGQEIEIRGSIDWLVCQEPCIPGKAEFSLTLTVVEEKSADQSDPRLEEQKTKLPRSLALEYGDFPFLWVKGDNNHLYLLTASEGPAGKLQAFYPLPPEGVFIEIPQKPEPVANFDNLSEYTDDFDKAIAIRVNSGFAQIEHLDGVLVFENSESRNGFLANLH